MSLLRIRHLLFAAMLVFVTEGPIAARPLPQSNAIERLENRCSAGDAEACFGLGRLRHDSEDKSTRNREAAARAYQAACDLGHFQACTNLGDQYLKGDGVREFRSVALYLYERACAAGNAHACYSLGDLTSQDEAEDVRHRSVKLLDWSCNAGHLDACARRADDQLSEGNGDTAGAAALLKATCADGNEQACLLLSNRLMWGNGMPKDVANAIAALNSGCDANGGEACVRLGTRLETGMDAPKDPVKAASAYDRSCQLGNLDGCEKAARARYFGIGVPVNKTVARSLFEDICIKDDTRCHSANTMKRAPQLEQECTAGDMQRCHDLAEMLNEQNALLWNPERAMELYRKACDGDIAVACLQAGQTSLVNAAQGGRLQAESALQLIDKGCTLGSGPACYELAERYAKGTDGFTDDLRAARLYARACDLSEAIACAKLDQYAELIPERPLGSADEAYKPPVDVAARDNSVKKPNCVVDEILFDGRLFREERCKTPVRVIRGFAVEPGSAPWQALIERPAMLNGRQLSATSRVLCGGSLIEQGWILTAAHCLYGDKKDLVSSGYRIRLGLHKVSDPEGLSYPIRQVIQHPGFRNGDKTLANDIALIRYDVHGAKRLGPSVGMRKIRIDTKPVGQRQIYRGMTAYAYGWGWTEATNSAASEKLRGGKLALQTEADCGAVTRFEGTLRNVVLCAQGPTGDQACYGDSGGPLVYYGEDDGAPTLIGVISSGKRCGTVGEPSRYTRVAKAVDWIRSVVWPTAVPAARR